VHIEPYQVSFTDNKTVRHLLHCIQK